MKKAMFSRFTSILQHAVDALAPQLSSQEEFVGHWKAVTGFFIDNKGEKLPVEQTSIPAHLEQMLVILQEEDQAVEGGMYGPCLEYLLQHKLLETLYSLGRTDYPPGMKQMVLSFFTKLLSRVKKPILAHVNVYRAVQRMVKTCGEVKAAPTEIEEIQFLCTVCAKIKADPYLVNFFLEMQKSRQAISTDVPIQEEPVSENKLHQEFHLVTTLLNLSHSEDSRVAVKACEGLILCSSLPEPVVAHCMINSTCFCDDLTQRLIDTFVKLPDSINPVDLEFVQAKWGMDIITEREDKQTFTGKRHLVSFLSWLDFCDQLSTIANPIVAEALARTIHQKFLLPYFKPALLQMSESGAITSMAYLTRCFRTVCSQRLLSEFALFLIGEDRKLEERGSDSGCLRSRLIERCNNVSEEVCLVALQLFDTLLQKDDEHILHNLVIRNLEGRLYCRTKHDLKDSENNELSFKESEMQSEFKNMIESSRETGHQMEVGPENVTESQKEAVLQNESESQKEAVLQDEAESQKEAVLRNDAESQKEAVLQDEAESQKECEHLCESESQKNNVNESNNNCDMGEGSHPSAESDIHGDSLSELKTEAIDNDRDKGLPMKSESTDNQETPSSTINLPDTEVKVTEKPHFSPVYSKTEVHKIVNSFLSLLPEELKSSYQTADSGYDMYLRDAHRQYTSMLEVTKNWDYPLTSGPLPAGTTDFYEGSFLHMLLDKLSHILDQSYPVNLQLTSIISKLALVPHPCLHEYLLDPYLPAKSGIKTLYRIFQKVSGEIKSKFESEPDLSHKLILVRKKLMGNSTTGQRFEGQNELEAIIVLEEFCKELSAIAFVKHHAAVTGDRTLME